jgi:hypothetical protein
MSKLGARLSLAVVLGLTAMPPSLSTASDAQRPNELGPLAFTLDEMNCFSSDIQARAVTPASESGEETGIVIADERGGGTNGIPCPRRDPKSPPAWRNQS